jgi:hypothetical protein
MGTGIYNPREQQSLPVKSWSFLKQFRYDIGDRGPGGGIITCTPMTPEPYSSPGRVNYYIEVAPPGWYGTNDDPKAAWGCRGTNLPGAGGQDPEDSLQNTIDIVTACTTPGIAADLARSYTGGGKTDWCLPALRGMTLAYGITTLDSGTTKVLNGDYAYQRVGLVFYDGFYYWGSTENNANIAYGYSPSQPANQYYGADLKDSLNKVRPIRVFSSSNV